MSAAVVHACSERHDERALCQRPLADGDGVSCFESDWTCRWCLRLVRLLVRVQDAGRRLRRADDLRTVLDAVAPGRAVDTLSEPEARRVLSVLGLVLAAQGRSL